MPVLVGVLHELFGFLFVFLTQSWLVAMPELQLVHGLMVTNSREAVDTSGLVHLVHLMHLVHLLWHWYTPGVTFCDFLVRICRSWT